jgi:hypothetical protein
MEKEMKYALSAFRYYAIAMVAVSSLPVLM